MSELRIALVAEGPTDGVLVEAALRAILPRPFTLTVLQPEPTRRQLGGGWCGVFKWCREFAARSQVGLEADPTLPGFDLFVIHIDADVADASYEDGGPAVVQAGAGLPSLPCSLPCPPPGDSADELRTRVIAWLGLSGLGPRTVLCVPSKAIEAWLAAGVLDEHDQLLRELECNHAVATQLENLPKQQRIRKGTREYQRWAGAVTQAWGRVILTCTQAARFQRDLGAVIGAGSSP